MIVRSVLALVLATGVFLALAFLGLLLGGSECDRGECNRLGEFIDDTAPLYHALALAVGIALASAVTRPWQR